MTARDLIVVGVVARDRGFAWTAIRDDGEILAWGIVAGREGIGRLLSWADLVAVLDLHGAAELVEELPRAMVVPRSLDASCRTVWRFGIGRGPDRAFTVEHRLAAGIADSVFRLAAGTRRAGWSPAGEVGAA